MTFPFLDGQMQTQKVNPKPFLAAIKGGGSYDPEGHWYCGWFMAVYHIIMILNPPTGSYFSMKFSMVTICNHNNMTILHGPNA